MVTFKSKKAILMLSLLFFGFSSRIEASSDLSVSEFLNEKVEEALSPLRKARTRTSSKLKNFGEKFGFGKKEKDEPEQEQLQTQVQAKSREKPAMMRKAPEQEDKAETVELETASIKSTRQYEEEIANSKKTSTGIWYKPHSLSSKEWKEIISSVKQASRKTGLPEQLILSLIDKESKFNPKAVSRSGAMGLTQLMPKTAQLECGVKKSDLMDIDKNINCGAYYLEKQLKVFGKLDLAIAAYNAGPGAVKRAMDQSGSQELRRVASLLKPETKPYVQSILAKMNYDRDFI